MKNKKRKKKKELEIEIIDRLSRTVESLEKRYKLAEKNVKVLGGQFYDRMILAQKEVETANKERNDAVRAYNGLHQLGKFAEEVGVDIKNEKLPENLKGKFEFSQKHTLNESGKVNHSFKLKPKTKEAADFIKRNGGSND